MEAILAALSTAVGKGVAAAAIAATATAGVAAAHAADVIDVPGLPDEASEEVPVEDVPADGPVVAETAKAKGGADEASTTEEEEADIETERSAESETDETPGEGDPQTGQGEGVDGQVIADDARDGGVVGSEVVAQTPAAEKAAADPGAPENPGEQGQDRRPETVPPAGDDASEEELEDDEGAPAPQAAEGQAKRP